MDFDTVHSSLPVATAGAPATSPRNEPASSSNLGRLLVLLIILASVWVGPYVLEQFQYRSTLGKMLAELEVATGGLAELKPRLDDFMMAARLVAKKVSPSVVSIHRAEMNGREEGQGSGVIIDSSGYILTNFHVVDRAMGLHVRLDDGRYADATVIGADQPSDLAILKIDERNLIAAEWGDSEDLQVGDLVWALGSPFGLDKSITFGIVSAKERRTASGISTSPYQEFLQTDVAVNPGNSGGPLVNIEGKVVGINTAILGSSFRGVSFAIPSSIAQEVYDKLIRDGYIERGYLGVQPRAVPETLRQELQLPTGQGVLVGFVSDGQAADKAGIRPGDIILQWNDHKATDPTLLSRAIAATEIGSSAKVLLKRPGQSSAVDLAIDVKVGRSPNSVKRTDE